MKTRHFFEMMATAMAAGAFALLVGCANVGSVTAWQKIHVQDMAGQAISGAIVRMTAEVSGNEEITTVGLADDQGGLLLPKSLTSTYFFSKDGYNTLVASATALFRATPDAAKRSSLNGDVLIVTLTKSNAPPPVLFDAEKLWQSGVVDPIKNMPLIPVNPSTNSGKSRYIAVRGSPEILVLGDFLCDFGFGGFL